MPQPDLIERHYEKVEGLVPHNAKDPAPPADEYFEAIVRVPASLQQPGLVSSAHGKLSRMMLTIPNYAVPPRGSGEPNPLAAAYRDLLVKLPESCDLLVATHDSRADEVERWISEANPDADAAIVSLRDHLTFSVWAEDSCVTVRDRESGDVYLLKPWEFPRYADALASNEVSDRTELRDLQAPLYFEGGNLLVGDTFFLLGADYPARTLGYVGPVIQKPPGETAEQTVHRLYREYLDTERDLIVIGSRVPVPTETTREVTIGGESWTERIHLGNEKGTKQPLFHIDMFITLAGRDERGKYRVLVGDPGKAAEALGVEPWEHAMQDVFDDIAEQLEGLGFRVLRNPLPLAYVTDRQNRQRTWYFATANNALVEIDEQAGRRVWIPTYGHGGWGGYERTDTLNRSMWEGLGFDVTMLGDFHPFAENLGAVHCIKKYLARG